MYISHNVVILTENFELCFKQNSVFQDASVLGSFLDNHDNPRFLSQNSDQNVLLSAMAYNIFAQVSSSFVNM